MSTNCQRKKSAELQFMLRIVFMGLRGRQVSIESTVDKSCPVAKWKINRKHYKPDDERMLNRR